MFFLIFLQNLLKIRADSYVNAASLCVSGARRALGGEIDVKVCSLINRN